MISLQILVSIFVILNQKYAYSQIALSLVSSSSLASSGLMLSGSPRGLPVRSMTSHDLLSKWDGMAPDNKQNSTKIEMDIAAVFRGVAYGMTTSPPTPIVRSTTSMPSTTTSTTTTTSRNTPIKDEVFIGHRADAAFNSEQNEVNHYPRVAIESKPDIHSNLTSNFNQAFTYYVDKDVLMEENVNVPSTKATDLDINNNDKIERSYHTISTTDYPVNVVKVIHSDKVKQKSYDYIKSEIGTAWNVHIYTTAISFGLVAMLAICCLFRINSCSHMLPRGYYVTFHLMIFLAAFFRCIIFFHDPYGANRRLPGVLFSMLYNTVAPCLITSFAVLFMVMLRAARMRILPFNLQSPLLLAIVSGIYVGGSVVIDVSVSVMNDDWVSSVLPASLQTLTVVWSSMIWFTYFILYPKIEKAALRQQSEMVRLTFTRVHLEGAPLARRSGQPSFCYSAKWFLLSSVVQVLWCMIMIYNIFYARLHAITTPSQAWSWWVKSCVEKALEIIACICLLACAYWLTQNKYKESKNLKNQKIFSIFTSCSKENKRRKESDVYPVSNEKSLFLGNYSLKNGKCDDKLKGNSLKKEWASPLHTNHQDFGCNGTLHSVSSDFQMVWNKNMNHYSEPVQTTTTMLVNDSGFVRFKKELDKKSEYQLNQDQKQKILMVEVPPAYSSLHSYSFTLPSNKYYCTSPDNIPPQVSHSSSRQYKSSTVRNSRRSRSKDHQLTNGNGVQLAHHVVREDVGMSASKYDLQGEIKYEVAPYYNSSGNFDGVKNLYSSPQYMYLQNNLPIYEKNPVNQQNIPNSTYLQPTYQYDRESGMFDPSTCSSQSEIHVDYLTDVSSSNDGLNNPSLPRNLPLSIKPIYTSSPLTEAYQNNPNLDITPDSAVVIDYSPTLEDENKTNRQDLKNNMTLDLLKISSSSLNDVIKNQSSGLLSKLVNNANGSQSVAYTPLDVDEVSSPSQEHPNQSLGKRSLSSGDLVEKIKTSSSVVIQEVDCDRSKFNSSPITSL